MAFAAAGAALTAKDVLEALADKFMSRIIVVNGTGSSIRVWVNGYGDRSWNTLTPGERVDWKRPEGDDYIVTVDTAVSSLRTPDRGRCCRRSPGGVRRRVCARDCGVLCLSLALAGVVSGLQV